MHANNPAAKQLEARWRRAIKMKAISLEQLDQCAPCTLTGDTEESYEPLRFPPATPDGAEPSIVFPHSSRSRLAPPSSASGSPGRAFE